MSMLAKDLFKLVSLRRSTEGNTIDPAADVNDSQVVELLNDMEVDPGNPSDDILGQISNLMPVPEDELSAMFLTKIHGIVKSESDLSYSNISGLVIPYGDNIDCPDDIEEEEDRKKKRRKKKPGITLAEYAATTEFQNAYRTITDSWLIIGLRRSEGPIIQIEELIRIAHLARSLSTRPDPLREPGFISRIFDARIVFPRHWRPLLYRQQALHRKYVERLANMEPPTTSPRARQIQANKQALSDTQDKIGALTTILSKVNRVLFSGSATAPIVQAKPTAAASATELGRTVGLGLYLTDAFYENLSTVLTDTEQVHFDQVLAGTGRPRPVELVELEEILGQNHADSIVGANSLCANIKVWEEEEEEDPPDGRAFEPSEDRPSVRTIGWGDLVVARERLVGYDAREIAHIENVLSGEEKVREHERTRKTEQFTETETIEETESEKDLQTTDRHELQSEAQKTISENYAIEAGINTSGRYGLTKVETSLDVGFGHTTEESRSSTIQTSREIVSRAIDRTFESVRKLRRLAITEQIRELNRHAVRNVAEADQPSAPISLSGIYLWVQKIHEIELRHYGTRLMVEFHIPEPGIHLLERDKKKKAPIPKPAKFTLGPTDITEACYLSFAKLFGAFGIEPPPHQYISVGFNWAATPDEKTDGDKADDTFSQSINIPSGYIPFYGYASVKAESGKKDGQQKVVFTLNVANSTVLEVPTAIEQDDKFALVGKEKFFYFKFTDPWPDGVPVTFMIHGHFDKTAVVHVVIRCQRSAQAFTDWQLRTWEALREAHQELVREYKQEVSVAAFQEAASLFEIPSRPESENRAVERNELKKWAIKTMRLSSFDFDAIETVGDFQEINPHGADFQAPLVKFFEESFEWREMTYFLFPYYWGRRETWKMRGNLNTADSRHTAFLQAGAARIIVPVTPGFEARVLYYLESDPTHDEFTRIAGPPSPEISVNSPAEDLWLDLLINKNEELALGSGTLTVEKNSEDVVVNDDSRWTVSERDLGREIFVHGDEYSIGSVTGERAFRLTEQYKGPSDSAARYATGSVPFGPPWLVQIPTSLVVLSEEKEKLVSI